MAISISEQENQGVLVLYDMETCQITQEIYAPREETSLENFSYSDAAPLALELHSEQGTEINLIGSDGAQGMTISGASDPSWSKDGKKLAYKNEQGGLCVLDFENNGTSCLFSIKSVGSISWSPDGKRVVYENENGDIEVLNLETRERVQIGQGNWPDWRP
jgi:WD40 repeat protein